MLLGKLLKEPNTHTEPPLRTAVEVDVFKLLLLLLLNRDLKLLQSLSVCIQGCKFCNGLLYCSECTILVHYLLSGSDKRWAKDIFSSKSKKMCFGCFSSFLWQCLTALTDLSIYSIKTSEGCKWEKLSRLVVLTKNGDDVWWCFPYSKPRRPDWSAEENTKLTFCNHWQSHILDLPLEMSAPPTERVFLRDALSMWERRK